MADPNARVAIFLVGLAIPWLHALPGFIDSEVIGHLPHLLHLDIDMKKIKPIVMTLPACVTSTETSSVVADASPCSFFTAVRESVDAAH